MAGSGGPWGGGGGSGGDNRGDDKRGGDNRGGGRRPGGEGPQIPEIDEIVKKGQEQLRVLMGGSPARRAAAAAAAAGAAVWEPARSSRGRALRLGRLASLRFGPSCRSTRCGPKNVRSSCSWASFRPSAIPA